MNTDQIAFNEYINSTERKLVSDEVAEKIINKVMSQYKFMPLEQRLKKIRLEMKNYVFQTMYGKY